MGRLIVLAPSIANNTSQFDLLLTRLRLDPQWRGDTDVLRFEHHASARSLKRADKLTRDLADAIRGKWLVDGPFDDIILMGQSVGGILVRAAYLQGLGSVRNNQEPQEWVSFVSRIVLFASFNRGIRLRWYESIAFTFMPWQSLLRDILVGSDFVTNVRLWWVRKLASMPKRPLVIQIRGMQDTRVAADDSVDVEGFLEGYQLPVDSTHDGLLKPDEGVEFSKQKYDVFRKAVLGSFSGTEESSRKEDPDRKVFFVVHGIRASNDDWVKAVSAMILSQVPNAKVIPPNFGRFSALQFVVPLLRRKKVRWFQDLYSSELAINPRASFNFVGHSYGTYLLGHAIKNLSGIQFDRVSLNGSVLPAQWSWDIYRHQVKELRNARAQRDIPVGILCSALRGLRMHDVGTAGYSGFQVPFDTSSERAFYKGAHSASVTGEARGHIVNFMLGGSAYQPQPEFVSENENFTRLSAGAWVLPYLLIPILALSTYFSIYFFSTPPLGLWHVVHTTLLVVGTFLVLAVILLTFI